MAEPGATDRLDDGLVARFRATLGPWLAAVPAGTAPLGAHWCLFPPVAPIADLGPDGHPPRLHPVSEAEFPRRMWVGGAIDFAGCFPVNGPIARETDVLAVDEKVGQSGRMLLAGLVHSYSAGQVAIAIERQDLAYRPGHADGAPAPSAPSSVAIPAADLRWDIETSAALLFRYSALTFNAHRIHYDRDYARHSEGYEDILVHGPLQATLLLNCAARLLGEAPARFRYRSLRPLPASLGAIVAATAGPGGVTCTAYDGWGRPTMEGNASL